MKQMNKTQLIFIILTLIVGVFYILFKSDGPTYPGLGSGINFSSSGSDSLKIANWKTKNNVPVYFVSARELPMVDIEVTFRAGSAYNPEHPGVAALTNAMLVEGTKQYNTEEISEKFESIGAEYSAGSGRDSANIALRTLTEKNKLNTALDIFSDVIANASFPEKSFNRLKNNTIEGLKLDEQYPKTALDKTFFEKIYKKHPYAIPSEGTIDTVSKIKREDLVDFYNNYYVSDNALISIVGDFDLDQAKQVAEKISQSIQQGNGIDSLPGVAQLDNGFKQHIEFPSTQTHIIIGGIGIKRSDPDYFALNVGNHVLGQMPLTSKLFKNVRIEKGLAYSVYSSFVAMQDAGPFIIKMQTRNEKAVEALDTSLNTLKDFMENGPSQEELDMAKQNLIGSFPLSIASNSKKLDVISAIGFYNLPLDYIDTYVNNINKITIDDVKEAFNRHVNLDKLAIVTVGNSSDNKNNSADNNGAKNIKETQVRSL